MTCAANLAAVPVELGNLWKKNLIFQSDSVYCNYHNYWRNTAYKNIDRIRYQQVNDKKQPTAMLVPRNYRVEEIVGDREYLQ